MVTLWQRFVASMDGFVDVDGLMMVCCINGFVAMWRWFVAAIIWFVAVIIWFFVAMVL